MNDEILFYLPIAKAIEALLHPFAEVVLHDIAQQKIVAILNNFSKRKIGDDSLLEDEMNLKNIPDFFEPYFKKNFDGRSLKSTTATLRNKAGKPIGFLCINLDISKLEAVHGLLSSFTKNGGQELPKELFKEDWREKISVFVQDHMKSEGTSLSALSREDKRRLINRLHKEGAFRAKHAASYVGDVLDLSRATVYKYLAELNREE